MNNDCVDITLTTISSRVDSVVQTIKSLLRQSYENVRVRLYISREPFLLDLGFPEVPVPIADLAQQSGGRFSYSFCPNIGPYRKLLPYLREFWGQSRTVVTVDDDTVYPANWLASLLDAHDRYRCQVAFRGHRIVLNDGKIAPYRSWMKTKIEHNPSVLILPTGKDGVLYNTAYFPIEVLNVEAALRLAPTADDLWFRWHLARNRIPVYLMNTDYRNALEENDYESSLYLNYNKGGNNDRAVADLDAYFWDHHKFSIAS